MNDNWLFVGAAFVATWAVLLGYLAHLQRATRRARALLESANMPGIQ
jgi:CcmD family protein